MATAKCYLVMSDPGSCMNAAKDWPGGLVPPEGLKNYMPEEAGEKKGVFPDQVRTYKANSIRELADKLKMDPDTLEATVNHYNDLVRKGQDDDFGKEKKYLIPVDTPPYYGIHRHLRVSAITNGLMVNKDNNVLKADGTPIKGLYAVGNCAGCFYGGVDYPMTIPGLSLGRCYTQGYLAGKHVAKLEGRA